MRGELSQEALVPLVLRHLIPSAYRPVLANRVFGRLLLGFAISYLGDGMSFVAVAWLAIELAPQSTAGLWVGGAVAAYTLPGVVGALLFGRLLRQASARRLLLADNVIRAAFLGAVPLALLAGLLMLPLYVVLLAVMSLLHAWGAPASTHCSPNYCPRTSGSPRIPW
jgi:MFS family permease